MRVLHVAAGNLYGGVERILEEMAAHAPAGSAHAFALSFQGRVVSGLDAAGAERHDLGPVRFSRPLSVWRARRRLRRLVGSFDRVVAHSPWAFAIAAPLLPVGTRVLVAHDALDGSHWTERRTARRVPSLVICNSQYTSRAVAQWLPAVRRAVVLPPVSAPPAAAADRDATRREFGAAPDTTVIVIASRFESWKGHLDLLQAASTLHGNWRVWIAGGPQRPHEAAYERQLRAAASSPSLQGRVAFLGERRDLARLLAAADVHCQPNTTPEPFGIAFVEALDAGLPVVTFDFGGASEIVTEACGILLPASDRGALAGALQRLVDDVAARRRLGDAGPPRARWLCDPATQVARFQEALQ
ncbi:MAG TPA: glycosyltransferase [Vicinamibacterales bacterium]